MPKGLDNAKELAFKVKFSGDESTGYMHTGNNRHEKIKSLFYSNELLLSENVTPGLFDSLSQVLDRLKVPNDAVIVFVYASADINAHCYLGEESQCVVRISSSLVDILDPLEFQFVLAHEIGHFLFSHGAEVKGGGSGSVESYIQQRAQEISADRIGLIGCDSLDVAIKALIKTVSGLSSSHLRFDVGSFLSQLRKVSDSSVDNIHSTHPSMLIRCRALLWFSINNSFIEKKATYSKEELSKLDKKIKSDMDKYVDSTARKVISKSKDNLSMWLSAYEIVKKDRFTKSDQEKFCHSFGQSTLESLISFLEGLSPDEAKSSVYGRVQDARKDLEALIPNSFDDEFRLLANKHQ